MLPERANLKELGPSQLLRWWDYMLDKVASSKWLRRAVLELSTLRAAEKQQTVRKAASARAGLTWHSQLSNTTKG